MQRGHRPTRLAIFGSALMTVLIGAAGCATGRTAGTSLPQPASVATGSRIAAPPRDTSGTLSVTGTDLQSTGRVDTAGALRALLPIVR